MASYTIRVELKDQTDKMRTELLFTMLDNGFSRSVVCERGFTYALPSNEFIYVGSEKIALLMNRIVTLISKFSKDPSVLVTRSDERCWSGLRVVHLEYNALPPPQGESEQGSQHCCPAWVIFSY